MNTIDYENEVFRQLNDPEFYKTIQKDPTGHISNLIKTVVQEVTIMGLISELLAKFLIYKQPRVPIFYILPRIHKAEFLPKGQPIVSASSSLLEPISKYVDSFLRSAVERGSSYIKDTKDFYHESGKTIPEKAVLVSMDVISLHTNILYDLVVEKKLGT